MSPNHKNALKFTAVGQLYICINFGNHKIKTIRFVNRYNVLYHDIVIIDTSNVQKYFLYTTLSLPKVWVFYFILGYSYCNRINCCMYVVLI